ncbi:MAG: acyl--CoA ligase [Clostridia bacterium]|nr:acyl--CoA ligase [Clostridia bacterium]
MGTATKKFDILDEKNQGFKVYHVETMKDLFKGREDLPSYRMFSTKWGDNGIRGLKLIEKEYDRSWYSCIKERWMEKKPKHEMFFYRGNIITRKEAFIIADKVAEALLALGVKKGDEIPCCLSNVPAVALLMLGANKIGAKLNCFGGHYDPKFIKVILGEVCDKVLFVTDDEYEKIAGTVAKSSVKKVVVISLADYLPKDPTKCKEYEEDFDKYYHYDNKAVDYVAKNKKNHMTWFEFLDQSRKFKGKVKDDNGLDTEFLVTYTSGSTRIGFPKREVHRNRSLITVGVFHDPDLCGNPAAQNLRGLALIHTDSDTDLITMISDALFQGWSVAFEPEYERDDFLEYLVVSKPNFCLATTNFLLKAARQYLIEKRLGSRKMPYLLAMMAVGEGCTKGEERFINTWFRKCHAGWGVNITGPVRLPIVTVGLGGGDTEHGGIYYSLFHRMNEVLKKRELKGQPYGMMPVPYAHCCVLKQNAKGEWEEAGYNENGLIVANSATTMARYKNDWEKTKALVITDKYGIDWVSCNVFGYIDDSGAIHMKDRMGSEVTLENGKVVFPYKLSDVAQEDPENLLSTVVTTTEEDGKTLFIVNFQYSPLRKKHKHDIVRDLDARMKKEFPDIHDHIRYRRFAERYPFPVTGAGKRNVMEVINMGMDYTFKLENGQKVWTGKHEKAKDPKKADKSFF